MSKYGRGLNKEIYLAVKATEIGEPFCTKDIKEFVMKRGWDIQDIYINVCLANAAAENHSLNYKKYFKSVGDVKYAISSSLVLSTNEIRSLVLQQKESTAQNQTTVFNDKEFNNRND